MTWKDLSNHTQIDMVAFVKNYLKEKPEIKLFIGCDSQNRGQFTHYALVVVLYTEGKGGKVIYCREKLPLIQDNFTKLYKEIEYSLQVAGDLNDNGIDKTLLTIDLDYNDDAKYFSNRVLIAAMGWATGMGYACRKKPFAASASHVADMIVKS